MRFSVYQHKKNDTGEIFYVGHGNIKRPWAFLRGRSKAWQTIYNQCGCKVEIIGRFETKQEAADLEIKLIAEYKAQGIPLVNVKPGGFDRNIGCPKDAEAKLKISQARLKTNGARKKTKTPLGVFESKVQAAKAHNVHVDTIGYRIRHMQGYELI